MIKNNRLIFFGLVVCLVFIISACGSGSSSSPKYENGSVAPDMPAQDYEYAPPAGEANTELDTKREEKKVKVADLSMETNDFETFITSIKETSTVDGGYVESYDSSIYTTSSNRDLKEGKITIRIPSDRFSFVLDQIKSLGRVKNLQESEKSETDRYYDIEARKKIVLTEEQRVLAMIEKAKDLKELIALEARLSSIRESIELYQSQLNDIDRRASFSTITINIREIAGEVIVTPVSDDFLSRLADSFKSSINDTIAFIEAVLVLIAGAIVPLLTIGIFLSAIIFVASKINNRRKKQKK